MFQVLYDCFGLIRVFSINTRSWTKLFTLMDLASIRIACTESGFTGQLPLEQTVMTRSSIPRIAE